MARIKVTAREFERIATVEMLRRFEALGFKDFGNCAFGREREGFIQGVGLAADRSVMKFHVSVGFVIRCLEERRDFVLGTHSPGLEVSHRLGEFRKNMRGLETGYHFYTEDELRGCFARTCGCRGSATCDYGCPHACRR